MDKSEALVERYLKHLGYSDIVYEPDGNILSELLTNAAKYGEGQITVRLEPAIEKWHKLSVCNDGPGLPDNFCPAASKGLGMKVIQSFVRRIGGELRARPGKTGHGACFSVLFD